MTQTRDPSNDPPAPEGQVYVCGACGKTAARRYAFNDASCFTWAVLCYSPKGHDEWTAVPEAKA